MTDSTTDTQSATYHRGKKNYGTGYDMMARIDELEAKLGALSKRHEKALVLGADNRDKLAKVVEALRLADATLSGAHMNIAVVERKVHAALAAAEDVE